MKKIWWFCLWEIDKRKKNLDCAGVWSLEADDSERQSLLGEVNLRFLSNFNLVEVDLAAHEYWSCCVNQEQSGLIQLCVVRIT